MRNVLLLEPNYKNKYPPIGLMKLATYYRNQGDNVVFYKGDLNEFIIRQVVTDCVEKFHEINDSVNWRSKYTEIFQYIKTRKSEIAQSIVEAYDEKPILLLWLSHYKDYYHKKRYIDEPRWDIVCVTTLFTFYWEITIKTIEFAKLLVKDKKNLMVGGVMATILADEIERDTGIKPYRGTLSKPGILDEGNKDIIDELPLDYSILDEIDYKYPDNNAYYGYTTRGCINKCAFCAVPTLEPEYKEYLPLMHKIKETAAIYGDQRNLLLMDNNILASPRFAEIISEIKSAGFAKDSKFFESNHLEICIKNLNNRKNDAAYIRKLFFLIVDLERRVSDFNTKTTIFETRDRYNILKLETATKDGLLSAAQELMVIYEKHRSKAPKQRYVDFNQGVDARLFNIDNVKLLSQIPVRPLRIAFDDIKSEKYYVKAIKLSIDAGIKEFSNYLLYNFKDKPIDLYRRLKINVNLCEEYSGQRVNIYSFPMKYHPIKDEKYFKNRDYVGENWNRKYVRAIQAILNSTKGKIGKGKSFFEKAFGKNDEEFLELLIMPETFIIYRFFFEYIGETDKWRAEFNNLNELDKEEALRIIQIADFNHIETKTSNQNVLNVLKYYSNFRSEIITPETNLYKLKQEYDTLAKSKRKY